MLSCVAEFRFLISNTIAIQVALLQQGRRLRDSKHKVMEFYRRTMEQYDSSYKDKQFEEVEVGGEDESDSDDDGDGGDEDGDGGDE